MTDVRKGFEMKRVGLPGGAAKEFGMHASAVRRLSGAWTAQPHAENAPESWRAPL